MDNYQTESSQNMGGSKKFLKSFSKIEKVLLGSLLVMAISILLSWVSVDMGMMSFSISGWEIGWVTKLAFFLIIGAGALLFFKKELGKKASLALSGLSVLYIIFRVIFPPKFNLGFGTVAKLNLAKIFDYAGIGLYLFVIASIVALVVSIKIWKNR